MRAGKGFLQRYIFWLFLFGLVLLFSGCLQNFFLPNSQQEKGAGNVPSQEEKPRRAEIEDLPVGVLYPRLYLVDGKKEYLLPVTVALPWTEGVAKATLNKLIEGPTPAQEMRYGLNSPLPPATKVRGLAIREGLAKLDLSADFLDYDPGEERFVLNSVLFTLLQFPAVKKVQLLVEGAPLETFPGGTAGKEAFGPEEGLNRETKEDEFPGLGKTQGVTVYFCTLLGENHVFYVPVTRFVPAEEDPVAAAVKELLKGPQAGRSLFSNLPAVAGLRSYRLEEGLLTVDFSRELLGYQGGLRGEKNILMQLVLTLTAIPGVEKVQVLIAGEGIDLPYGTSFKEPLAQPVLVNALFSSYQGSVPDSPEKNGINNQAD
ncbi:MAG: hypothetical protein GX334_07565 [Firmicutes bacterium]|nr:hypothetical protein [Bacillota bacterium]